MTLENSKKKKIMIFNFLQHVGKNFIFKFLRNVTDFSKKYHKNSTKQQKNAIDPPTFDLEKNHKNKTAHHAKQMFAN